MNILDVSDEEVETLKKKFNSKDNLDLLFLLAEDYVQRYGVSKKNINTKEGQAEMKKAAFNCIEEICELTNALKNRSWTKTETPVDKMHAIEEYCDALAFMLYMGYQLDLLNGKLVDYYVRKYLVNMFRIKSGY